MVSLHEWMLNSLSPLIRTDTRTPMRVAHLSLTSFLALFLVGCGKDEPPVAAPLTAVNDDARFEKSIQRFCGDCHGMPRPSSFPKSSWEEEVEQGYQLFFDSRRTDLSPPIPQSRVLEYFTDRADEEFQIELPPPAPTELPVNFVKQQLLLTADGPPVYTSNVRFVADTGSLGTGFFACDMNEGRLLWNSSASKEPATSLETFHHPAHVTVCDLDQDSIDDYLVADLGSFLPSDHSKGKLYWLRQSSDGSWEKKTLVKDVGRITSAATGDFDSDGDPDIVVTEFGWRDTGAIHLLTSEIVDGNLRFQGREIDPRAGAIDVQTCDLNNDGLLDFVTLLAQEHEAVIGFINKGRGSFEPQVIWEATFPSYGSSGFELVDLDLDGDLDVIYTNGDSFDDFHIKPYHYVQWLENEGGFPFRRHQLATMPGVHRALPGDFDGDGDLDIVAVGMLPPEVENPQLANQLDSVILLEQVEETQFVRHRLQTGFARHPTMTVGDFDGDSDLDFAVGIFRHEDDTSRLDVWMNQLIPNK